MLHRAVMRSEPLVECIPSFGLLHAIPFITTAPKTATACTAFSNIDLLLKMTVLLMVGSGHSIGADRYVGT